MIWLLIFTYFVDRLWQWPHISLIPKQKYTSLYKQILKRMTFENHLINNYFNRIITYYDALFCYFFQASKTSYLVQCSHITKIFRIWEDSDKDTQLCKKMGNKNVWYVCHAAQKNANSKKNEAEIGDAR